MAEVSYKVTADYLPDADGGTLGMIPISA